jgi:phospholipase C
MVIDMPVDPIKHVVLLALENHSFDQMLGSLKQLFPELEGVSADARHQNVDSDGTIYFQTAAEERQMPLDPHHEVEWVAEQMQDANGGFVRNFSKMYPQSQRQDRQNVIGYYPAGFLPGLHSLAKEFTICDHWFSSLPGPTWPNRFMMLTGTAMGRVNMPDDGTHKTDLRGYFQQTQDTVFDRLTDKGIHWKSYFHDIPQSWVLDHQRLPQNAARYFYIAEFYSDARGREADFPQFCFIEPDFMGIIGNDDHPPHDVMKAEKLIADVYNALRANPDLWRSTLLVVLYDEHGGFYDHVVPPATVRPDNHHEEYGFQQLGIRVPALLVSPWVDRRVDKTLFDHTSLLKYLTDKWQLEPLPSNRIAQATSIAVALRAQARENSLSRIELTADQLVPPSLEREEQAISDNSTHDQALTRLRDFIGMELDEEVPGIYATVSRWIMSVKAYFWSAGLPALDEREFSVSIAEPDKLGTADVSVKDDIATALMTKKKEAVPILAQNVRDTSLSEARRRHAAQTLELISGRRFHDNQKLNEAEQLLRLHGK